MKEEELGKKLGSLTFKLFGLGAIAVFLIFIFFYIHENPDFLKNFDKDNPEIPVFEASMVEEIGFINDDHVELVITKCTSCHSAKLVIQNRATREGWQTMIRWMQRTQNLQDLGDDESNILDYLSKNYAPAKQGRRANLRDIDWYKLD